MCERDSFGRRNKSHPSIKMEIRFSKKGKSDV
jgi:hypothetical protein